MANRILLLLLGTALLFPIQAQTIHKSYPEPKLTPEIKAIKAERKLFKITASEDVVLPKSVDNSKSMYFPKIINQAGGSCAQASGIGYMFTYEINRMLGRDAKLSADNRFSYLFTWNMLNEGIDQGSFVEDGLNIAKRYGVMTEADYGPSGEYQFRWANSFDKYVNAMHYRAAEILTFKDSIPILKRYLYDAGDGSATGGVLTFSCQSTGWTINNYYDGPSETGYHSLLTKLATEGSHAVTIAGYDDLVTYTDDKGITHTGAFIVVNSWGTYSHDEGRFYLPYDFFRSTSVKSYELSDKLNGVKVKTYDPKVVYKVNIDFSSRDDLSFKMGARTVGSTQTTVNYYSNPIFNFQGGDHPMQGNYLGTSLELALDFSERLPQNEIEQYYLNVYSAFRGKKRGEGQVKSIQVYDYRYGEPRIYSCHEKLPRTLGTGNNIFAIALKPKYIVSTSPYAFQLTDSVTTGDAYLLRTASGKHAKMKVMSYNAQTGQIQLRYSIRKE